MPSHFLELVRWTMLIIVIVVGVIVAVVGVVLVNVTILFCQQLVTETKYYRLIKVRSRMLQATLTSGNTDTESNFRTLFNMLYKYRRCTFVVRSRFGEEVSFTGEFSALEIRIGLLSSPCIFNLSLLEKSEEMFLNFKHRECQVMYINIMQWTDTYMNR